MKKLFNVIALVIIVGLVGSWECGNCTFAELLQNTGTVLSVLFVSHIVRIVFLLIKHNKRVGKKNVIIS